MSDLQLLDSDGAITAKFEACLAHIFSKYCTPPTPANQNPTSLLVPPAGAYMNPQGLDKWAQDTNDAPLNQEMKEEIQEFLDVDENDNLTFKGFVQIYQLQTENDEKETWRDLAKHGFDRNLALTR